MTNPSLVSKRRNVAGERSRERILDVAEALFAERGVAGTTLQDIADGAELRKPSLYRHYESKQAIHSAVLDRGIAPLMEALYQNRFAGDLSRARANVTESGAKMLGRRHHLAKIMLRDLMRPHDEMDPHTLEWLRSHREAFSRLVALYSCESEQEGWIRLAASFYIVLGYYSTEGFLAELGIHDFLESPATDHLERTLDLVLESFLRN